MQFLWVWTNTWKRNPQRFLYREITSSGNSLNEIQLEHRRVHDRNTIFACSVLTLPWHFCFFQQVSAADTRYIDIQAYSSWSSYILSTPGFSPAASTLHAIYHLLHWPWSVVSAILDILLLNEAQTRNPVLTGVLPTSENMLLFIFCQHPFSVGKVNLCSSVPRVSNIGPEHRMAKWFYASFWYCCFALAGIMTDLSALLQFWRQAVGPDKPTGCEAVLIF